MSVHDALVIYRKRVVDLVEGSPNRRAACRQLGIHHSTFYRWRDKVADRDRGRRRRQRWADQYLEQEIVSFVLGHPGYGPRRVADELALRQVTVSPSRVWRVMVKHRINTRQLRYDLLAAHRQPPQDPVLVVPTRPHPPGQLQASQPGELVQFDCFHVGSFKETRLGRDKTIHGQIWQYTAIDVASSWLWVELESSPHNPEAAVASKLAHRVAADLTTWNWPWQAATTDNGNEFRSHLFGDTLTTLGVEHRFIRAGRPQTNGKAERVQGTLLEEFYQPTLIGYTQPSISGLRLDLNNYVHHYNWKRPHRGKWNQGQTPAQIIQPKTSIQK